MKFSSLPALIAHHFRKFKKSVNNVKIFKVINSLIIYTLCYFFWKLEKSCNKVVVDESAAGTRFLKIVYNKIKILGIWLNW